MKQFVTLSDNYNRSTNLELDHKDSKKLKSIYVSSKFDVALREILNSILDTNSKQRVQVLSGSPGLGKSTFALLASQMVSKKHPKAIKKLLIKSSRRLKNQFEDFQKNKKTKLLPVFFNGYEGEIEDVFVSKLISSMKEEGIKAKKVKAISSLEFYKQSLKLLNEKGIHGIFVVYDEFGKYLERGVHSPTDLNIQFLQDFAEFCDRSGALQCHLTLITHLSVSQYASQLPLNVQKEWAKIEGRFKESAFYDKSTDYYKMISSVFLKNISKSKPDFAKKHRSYIKTFLKNFKSEGFEGFKDIEDIEEIILNCFPLHPSVLAFLPLLSKRIAQNERTLYTFLTRDENHSLKRFLEEKEISEKNLLMPYDLYRYFSLLIGKDIGIGGTYKVHLMVEEALGKVQKDDEASKQILALIALSTVLKNFHFAPLNEEFIQSCLSHDFSKDKIKKSLLGLKKKKIIFYNKNINQYILQEGTPIDIDEEIGKLKTKKLTSKDLVAVLKRYFKTDFIAPKKYNFDNSITRFFRTEMISVEELGGLKNKKLVNFQKEDGVLYYVIPFSFEELEYTKAILKTLKFPLTVFVSPCRFIECRKDIEELNAVAYLYHNKDIFSASPLVKKELDRHKEILLTSIHSILKTLTAYMKLDAEIMYPSKKKLKKISHFKELQRFLGEVFSDEYCKYTAFNLEYINRHHLSGTVTLGIKKVINQLILRKAETKKKNRSFQIDEKNPLNIEGMGPDYAISKTLYGISKFKYNALTDRYEASQNSDFHNFYKEYKAILSSHKKGLSAEKIIDILSSFPYGLRLGVIPLFMAFSDLCSKQPINHYFEEAFVPSIDGNHYDLLMKYPKKAFIHYSPIDAKKQKFLEMLKEIFPSSDTSINSIIKGILKWRKGIPASTKSSENLYEEDRKLLIMIDSSKEPDRLLFERMPESFAYSIIDQSTKTDELEKIVSKISQSKNRIEKIYKELLLDIKRELLNLYTFIESECLEQKIYQSKENDKNIAFNFQKLSLKLKAYPFSDKTMAFLHRIDSFDPSQYLQYFIETIGDVLTGSSPRFWDTKGFSKLKIAINDIQTEIELASEVINPHYKGKSVIVFIDKEEGTKEFVKIGTKTALDKDLKFLLKKIESLLETVGDAKKNKILLSLLLEKKNIIITKHEKVKKLEKERGIYA